MEYPEVLLQPEYDFLRTNPNAQDNILIFGYAGGKAYGSWNETRDIDTHGVAADSFKIIVLRKTFRQFRGEETHTTVNSLHEFVKQVTSGQLQPLSLLFQRDSEILLCSEAGRILRENRQLFLSNKLVKPFLCSTSSKPMFLHHLEQLGTQVKFKDDAILFDV